VVPYAKVVHDIPGRLRIRITDLRGANSALQQIRERLQQFDGVEKAEVNPMTGSILVLHDTSAESIIERAEAQKLLVFSSFELEVQSLRERVGIAAGDLDEKIRSATKGALDLRAVVALVFTIAAGRQVTRQNVWPAAGTLLQYASNLLKSDHPPSIVSAEPAATRGSAGGGPRMLRIN
jgi:hypothetical protein